MGRLVLAGNVSLDGYINDADGNIDFSDPDDEVHQFWNDFDNRYDTHVYGRRLYEVMAFWETYDSDNPVMAEYGAMWRRQQKIVVSSTLESVSTGNTTLWRDLSGLPDLLAQGDATIGGPTLAAQAADLITDIELVLVPVTLGGGTAFWPPARQAFEFVESTAFTSGQVHLHYRKAL